MQLNTKLEGLSSSVAELKLVTDGYNEIRLAENNSFIKRIKKILHEPMFMLLLIAAAIYIAIGDLTEGITLGLFVVSVLGLTFYQEGKSEKSIQSLRKLNQHHARVIRNSEIIKIPSHNIVIDDLVLIAEGNRVPADGILIQADNLEVDESLLTGESVAVTKDITPPMAVVNAIVYSGTYVVRGEGIFKVTATGSNTEVGKIGDSLNKLTIELTPLNKQIANLVKLLAMMGLGLCTAMVIMLGLRTGDWIPAVLSGIALAMSILPEEYTVVLAIFPALGAHRLAKQGVITRRINAIETLGATSVLCTDKTGTLTQNKMKVAALVANNNEASAPYFFKATSDNKLPEYFHRLIDNAILASSLSPQDPMEVAFQEFGKTKLVTTFHLHNELDLVKTYPLSPNLRAMAQIWRTKHGSKYFVSVKGAPESVMDLCHLPEQEKINWSKLANDLADQGLRVIAAASAVNISGSCPVSMHDFEFEWLGIIGLADPLREEVPNAMAECHRAGIRVIMITGDYPKTAQAIATQAGMLAGEVITGEEVDHLNDDELQNRLRVVNICARISPQQKLRIVEALKRQGEIVTMTGDGVNDAPALKSAHVGIAMGSRGTDVAREAADLVLSDNNFASIVRGISTGRLIFKNLQKSMTYIFAIHIPIAMLALFPMLFALPPIFLPLHIALLEMIIDPACSLAFENEPSSDSCMTTPPRDTTATLFGKKEITYAFIQGILVLVSTSVAYWISENLIYSIDSINQMRSMVMVAFVVANGHLIFISKTEKKYIWQIARPFNWVATTIATSTICLVFFAIYFPLLSNTLKFSPLGIDSLAIAIACGSIGLILNLIADLLFLGFSYRIRTGEIG
jgi:Ca2+-transporting ATPase